MQVQLMHRPPKTFEYASTEISEVSIIPKETYQFLIASPKEKCLTWKGLNQIRKTSKNF